MSETCPRCLKVHTVPRCIESDLVDLRSLLAAKDARIAELERQREHYQLALACYANDEDRYLSDEGEPYGSIPTEAGITARAARDAQESQGA